MKGKKIIIVGKTCSGKSTLKQKFIDKGFACEVSYTTRPRRNDEIDGKDYHFITEKEFTEKIKNGFFVEYTKDYGYYYGTAKDEFNNKGVFIMTPSGIRQLTAEQRNGCYVIYCQTKFSNRIRRMKQRDWKDDKINLRLKQDNKQFVDFKDFDKIYYN